MPRTIALQRNTLFESRITQSNHKHIKLNFALLLLPREFFRLVFFCKRLFECCWCWLLFECRLFAVGWLVNFCSVTTRFTYDTNIFNKKYILLFCLIGVGYLLLVSTTRLLFKISSCLFNMLHLVASLFFLFLSFFFSFTFILSSVWLSLLFTLALAHIQMVKKWDLHTNTRKLFCVNNLKW